MTQTDSRIVQAFTNAQSGGRTINAGNGSVICDANAPADNVYFVSRGQVRIYGPSGDNPARLIEILGEGQWFGAASLAGAPIYGIKALAIGAATVIEVRVEKLLTFLFQNPTQLMEFNHQLAQKLLLSDGRVALMFKDCNQRLIGALIRFSDSAASTLREDGVILRITHNQLAQAIGVARETVSLALTDLRQRKLLQTGRNQLVFNPDLLKQYCGNSEFMERVA